jgi:hypothetical protein
MHISNSQIRDGNGEEVLLSIMYGIPKTIIMLNPAMRIIGFLRRLNGETVIRSISNHSLEKNDMEGETYSQPSQ